MPHVVLAHVHSVRLHVPHERLVLAHLSRHHLGIHMSKQLLLLILAHARLMLQAKLLDSRRRTTWHSQQYLSVLHILQSGPGITWLRFLGALCAVDIPEQTPPVE